MQYSRLEMEREWQLIFPKFTSNSSRIIYLYLSLSSRLHAFERIRMNEIFLIDPWLEN